QGLTVKTDGTTEFDGPIGTTALSALDVQGNSAATLGNTDLNAPTVNTMAGQTYENAVKLSTTATLTDTGGGKIWFKSTLDAAAAGVQGVTVNTAGPTEFDAAVGSTAALASLATGPLGTAAWIGAKTTGTENYQARPAYQNAGKRATQ